MLFDIREMKLEISKRVIIATALCSPVQKGTGEQMTISDSQLDSLSPRAARKQINFLADELAVFGIGGSYGERAA